MVTTTAAPGAKATLGTLGLAGAAAYAPDLTIVTKWAAGMTVDAATFEKAVDSLINAGWAGVCIAAGLVIGFYWNKALVKFGAHSNGNGTV